MDTPSPPLTRRGALGAGVGTLALRGELQPLHDHQPDRRLQLLEPLVEQCHPPWETEQMHPVVEEVLEVVQEEPVDPFSHVCHHSRLGRTPDEPLCGLWTRTLS